MSEIRDKYHNIPDIKDLPYIENELDKLEDRLEKLEISLNTFLQILKISEINVHVDSTETRSFNNMKVKIA